jgi:hypothetical protein
MLDVLNVHRLPKNLPPTIEIKTQFMHIRSFNVGLANRISDLQYQKKLLVKECFRRSPVRVVFLASLGPI